MKLRGISPVIATVIILAVTIAIAIAVVGWVMGLFRSSTKTGAELKIMPDSFASVNETIPAKLICLHIRNVGTAETSIDKVIVSGLVSVSSSKFNSTKIKLGDNLVVIANTTLTDEQIKDNCGTAPNVIKAELNNNDFQSDPVAGVTYSVEILTKDGFSYQGVIQGK
ncbi:hypothetical protein PYJP_20630 [Pyrofollis japonicus]|uniref:archaellin/type IV pilin N-terminal domain-containing protein n=1 Tax=Pyrofollis japonicus TaxID=3060460 RepID=UPI00295B4FAE|nr:archaellin/type IV pilin N-terminal domain-containing protein [Pyrofollis japonicus]BEP18711.1 hypothetical protein PYJP_20630 [Pyrofollis japonicus]